MSYRSFEPKQMDYLCGKKPGFGWPVDLSYFMVLCGEWAGHVDLRNSNYYTC